MTDKERVVDWSKSTKKERRTLYFLIQAIRSAHGLSWNEIYFKAHGKPVFRGKSSEDNFRKGDIGQDKAAPIFRWVAEHHLTFAKEHAPEIFDPSLLTRWSSFIAEHGIYDQLNPIFLNALGLTKRSSKEPIHDLRINLTDEYCFELESAINGSVLAFEGYKGEYYPMSLHVDGQSFLTPYETGKHLLPFDPKTEKSIPLMDTDHAGVHKFVFIVAPTVLFENCTEGFVLEKALTPKQLDELAFVFKDIDLDIFEVHRLNVIFK